MGSGCNTGTGLSTNVLRPTPDTSVIYTGVPIPALGICTGDTLSEVESIILNAIIGYASGQGISIPNIDLTTCALFTSYITCCTTTDSSLDNLMQIIFKALCVLYNDYTTLQALVAALLNGPYNTGCLTLGANPTLSQIVQELILEFCTVKTQVAANTTAITAITTGLPATIGTFLAGAIQACQTGSVTKSGTGAGFTVTFGGFCPIGTILPYVGPIAGVFDSTGMGMNPGPCCGWALTNGATQNGITTTDMRGYGMVGVNDGSIGSGAQNNEVNNSLNPGQAYALNAHGGNITHTLTPAEIPATPLSGSTASVTATAYIGDQIGFKTSTSGNNGLSYPSGLYGGPTPPHNAISATLVVPGAPITGSVAGGGGSHDIRSPYRAVYFIQRVA